MLTDRAMYKYMFEKQAVHRSYGFDIAWVWIAVVQLRSKQKQ